MPVSREHIIMLAGFARDYWYQIPRFASCSKMSQAMSRCLPVQQRGNGSTLR